MQHDAETRAYVEKRRAEYKTDREVRRCLKRYIARRIFNYSMLQPPRCDRLDGHRRATLKPLLGSHVKAMFLNLFVQHTLVSAKSV